jgi:hypothetical protein
MSNYGIKVSKPGVNVRGALTATNKKFFQFLSVEGALVENEKSASSSNTNVFLGYRLTNSNTRAYPINHSSGDAVYVIYKNKFDD